MAVADFFAPIPRWDMDAAKAFMEDHPIGEYNLIDVREPAEFEEGHIPGAISIPLSTLPQRAGELDRDKKTLVYCRSGGRAGNGTTVLARLGFPDVHNIGGIMEWKGLAATGAPEAGMAIFDAARSPADYVAVAWEMEEGARVFYRAMAERFGDLSDMFEDMATGEVRHRDRLGALHAELTGSDAPPSAPDVAGMMEGGVACEKAIAWSQERSAADVLELAAALEANAHDRYIHVGRKVGGATEEAFIALAEAEKVHLGQLMEALALRLA